MKPGAAGGVTRRGTILAAGASAAAAVLPSPFAWAQAGVPRHGLAVIGDLKYPADFAHFDYVDADAPKGGEIILQASTAGYNQTFAQTFNTLNMFVDAGQGAHGMEETFARLMDDSSDEPGSVYGYAASTVEVADDGLTYRFRLRPEARFDDGTPITADDVAFSINILKDEGHANLAADLFDMKEAVAESTDTVRIRFAEGSSLSLPVIVAQLPIFSRAWWQGREFGGALSEAPLASGPYRVKEYVFGSYILYERVEDFWGASLPAMRGRHNFDRVRYVYFRDRLPAFESFKKGETTFREEFTSRIWASDYTFPAVTEGRVIRDETPDASLSAGQAWFFNTRRAKFADPIVREALTNAFDFEWTNQNLMFGSYARSASYFENSALKASGKPEGAELALLEPFRDQLPARVFDADATVPPVSDGTGSDRVLLGVASDLLARAGCMLSGATLLTPAGEPFTIEFLSNTQVFEPHHNRYIINLARLGIEASYRLVDGAQYEERMNDFDFDMTVSRANTALYPSVSLRQAFSSQAASQPGSRNYAGIADPAVDALVEAAVGSREWDAFVTATRALDRVLRARHYTVPQWYKGTHWLAFWDVFGRPPPVPLFERAAVDTWWYDSGKAARIDKT